MIWIYIPIMRGNGYVREASPLFNSSYSGVIRGVLEEMESIIYSRMTTPLLPPLFLISRTLSI